MTTQSKGGFAAMTATALILVAAVAVSGCGRRAPLERPSDVRAQQVEESQISSPTNLPIPDTGGADSAPAPEDRPTVVNQRSFVLDRLVR